MDTCVYWTQWSLHFQSCIFTRGSTAMMWSKPESLWTNRSWKKTLFTNWKMISLVGIRAGHKKSNCISWQVLRFHHFFQHRNITIGRGLEHGSSALQVTALMGLGTEWLLLHSVFMCFLLPEGIKRCQRNVLLHCQTLQGLESLMNPGCLAFAVGNKHWWHLPDYSLGSSNLNKFQFG